MNSFIRKSWLALPVAAVLGFWPGGAMAQSRLVATTHDGGKYEFEIGAGRSVALPLSVKDEATGNTLRLTVRDVDHIVTAEGAPAVGGVRRWEVQRVATPSLVQGRRNTDRRLLDVVAVDSVGTLYRWVRASEQNGTKHFGLWYGIKPVGAKTVYPFIQDGKVWFRDLRLVLGSTCPAFVDAATAKYMEGKGRLDRQASLRQHPEEILSLQVK
jgi:hypothetical protein